MEAEVYRIIGQYKVRYNRENVSAVDDHSETITEIARVNIQIEVHCGFTPKFFSRGDGHYHVIDMLPGGSLFLGRSLAEAIVKLREESALSGT